MALSKFLPSVTIKTHLPNFRSDFVLPSPPPEMNFNKIYHIILRYII